MKSLRYITFLFSLLLVCTIANAQASHWTCDERQFEYSMAVFMSASVRYQDVDLKNYEIAAFCGDECRGIMSIEQVNDVEYGYLRIRSNNTSGESIGFKVYNKSTSQELASDSIVSFLSNSRIGYPSETYKINFGGYIVNATSADNEKGTVTGSGEYGSNSEISLLATPNTGYHFDSWSDGSTKNPYIFQVTGNLDLTASFSPNQYAITFDTDGGSEIAPITQDYNSTVTAPADPTKTGYTFAGWDKEIPATMPAEDITIKALWTINQYTITFDTDGGSEIAPITQDYNSTVTAPADPTKTGYTFAGWDKEIPATMPAEDITIKALWTINQYTITFDTDGGSEIAPITQDYNRTVTAPADPTKTGYTFAGWDKEIPTTIPAEDITIKALWTINQYTITFDTDGGSEIAPITQDYKSTVTAPTDPTKTGYTFAGWDKEIPATIPAEDITIKALWTINQYKVTFIAEGVIVSENLLDYGSRITAPDAPEKDGYTFSSWGKVDETVPDHDVTYTASYDVNYYKLTYILDDEVYAEFDVAFGETINPLEVEPEEGRTFEGWTDVPETMPSHDVVVYGRSVATSIHSTALLNNEKVSIYNMNGVLVKKNVDFKTLHGILKSGIYIVNGKKIRIK